MLGKRRRERPRRGDPHNQAPLSTPEEQEARRRHINGCRAINEAEAIIAAEMAVIRSGSQEQHPRQE